MSDDDKKCNSPKFVTTKKATEILGVHYQTLYYWEKKGKIETIRTPGGRRLYNVVKYLETYGGEKYQRIIEEAIEKDDNDTQKEDNDNKEDEKIQKRNICYVRVSTLGQKDDLERQKKYMKDKYPTYDIIADIGSGINFNRQGIRRIIRYAIDGEINRVVVAYKDRLTRFGFELIEDLIKEYSKGEIVIEDNKGEKKEPKEELIEDVLQILNVYTAKLNGLRKYTKKVKKNE